jgi:3-oxoacyl-(acyl-carrier-protein) synthase III
VNVGIVACGGWVPPDVMSNDIVAQWADTTPNWIIARTGIRERRYAPAGMRTSELGRHAVRNLVQSRPDALSNLGAIIVATSTPDQPQPPTAAILQGLLELEPVPAFDVNGVCCGFLYALWCARGIATSGTRVLVVAADRYSGIMDDRDARTLSIFGDGAGAVVVGTVPDGYGIVAIKMVTHGSHRGLVEVQGGGTACPLDAAGIEAGRQYFRMRGRAVREYVDAELPRVITGAIDAAGWAMHDVDRFILHQANPRMLEQLAAVMGIHSSRMPLTAPEYGNSGAASMPVTLWETNCERPIGRGEKIVFAGVGGGMTAGAIATVWY